MCGKSKTLYILYTPTRVQKVQKQMLKKIVIRMKNYGKNDAMESQFTFSGSKSVLGETVAM